LSDIYFSIKFRKKNENSKKNFVSLNMLGNYKKVVEFTEGSKRIKCPQEPSQMSNEKATFLLKMMLSEIVEIFEVFSETPEEAQLKLQNLISKELDFSFQYYVSEELVLHKFLPSEKECVDLIENYLFLLFKFASTFSEDPQLTLLDCLGVDAHAQIKKMDEEDKIIEIFDGLVDAMYYALNVCSLFGIDLDFYDRDPRNNIIWDRQMCLKKIENEENIAVKQGLILYNCWTISVNFSKKYGIDLFLLFNAVHDANMDKRDPVTKQFIIRESDGKVLKREGWVEADLKFLLFGNNQVTA